jgi:pyruvate dehydrogenase E1 component alpha subunit
MARLYRQMLRMRLFEEGLGALWEEGLISGELHLGIGEEGIVAGVLDHLGPGDALALDHRTTPALVGWGVDLTSMALEMVGSEDGLCAGRGGHMHLFAPEMLAASSGIVGAAAPLACGFALSHQHLRQGKVAVAFFGESTINQGMTMEAFNLAAVWRLPVVFVVKDNGWAITTRSDEMTAGTISRRARAFGMRSTTVDGSDVAAVWNAALKAIEDAREHGRPSILHATCYRPRGHFEDDPLVRMVEHPIGSRAELGGLLRGVIKDSARASQRIAGLARVTRTIGSMALDRFGRRRDPVRNAKQALSEEEMAEIGDEARVEIAASLAAARGGAGDS